MKSLSVFICLMLTTIVVVAKDYTSYKVYKVSPNKTQLKHLMEWEFQTGIDFWSAGGTLQPSQIMVSPDIEDVFLNFLNLNEIKHELFIDDVESSLQRDKADRLTSRVRRNALLQDQDDGPDFEHFWSYDEIEAYTIQLEEQYPLLVKRDVIGKSVENRDILGIRISSGSKPFGVNPIIFIDAGVHAREWVGPHAVLYLINELVTNSTVSSELLENVDWVIVPSANPDGYVYSMEEDRLWRKNRRYVNYTCTGIDLNRNFRFEWKYNPNSCTSDGHSGPYPISEPEVKALTSYMESFKYNLRMYLSTHSYGPMVLWPFGFEEHTYVKNWKEHIEVGQKWVDAIYAHDNKTLYRLGNSADILYTANGASDDHAVAFANANLAYTLELPGGGRYGFDYPQDMVAGLSQQTFLGYREFGLYIGEHYNYD